MGNSPSAPSAFETCVRGVLPGDAISTPADLFYKQQAVKAYNTEYDITPVAVVRPSTTEQVSGVVKCATDNGIKVAARSGGHSYADYCLGGESGSLVVDMVNFQQFSMDESTGHASIGSGTLLGDVTERLHDAGGRAIAHGTCPQVGIGGHATIGGLGPISRQWGTALDHVIEAEVVLANGTILRTNSVNHPEVLWGLKGAASSLGVITEFVVYTHEEPKEITKYSYNLEFGNSKDAANTFKLWQKMMAAPDLPRQLASQAIAFEFGLIVQGTWFGPQSEFDAFDFDGKLGKTASSIITLDNWLGAVSNWAEKEAIKMAGGMPGAFYSKSLTFRNDTLIPDNTIDSLFELFDTADKGTPIWFVIADLAGGAVNDIPMDGTAYAHRDVLFYIQTYAFGIGSLPDSSRTFLTDINNMIEAALPNVKFGAYAGYVDPAITNGQERYWGSNLPQLEQLKGQLDPTDSFHNPQSIRASS